MSSRADLELWHALYGLEVRYWHAVDHNGGHDAHTFYAPDGLFAVGDNEFRGCEKIREFYSWRHQRGLTTVRSLRTTRHLISNFHVESTGPGAAKASGVISFFDAAGRPPVMESKPAILVADLINECVLGEDAQWRFKSHRLRPIFMGDDVPLSLAVDVNR